MRSSEVLLMLLAVLMLCSSTKSSQLEIQAFQPAVVPIRATTTLTLKTNADLNVTSNTSLKCRFKDISVPARIEGGFIFCDTPPIKNTDRVSVHLDVDGKLIKTKKPLYFHEPFKVSNITPSVVSPAQHVHLTISGISCKEWMQYFVRFQTANGTKMTQQGICRASVVSCFVPEFPPNTVLRVGLTLSNRLVEWADAKIIIQYPVDAIKSFVKDITTDFTKKGAFTFVVALKDRFKNPIKVTQRINKNRARISVQYSSKAKPQSLRFLKCTTTVKIDGEGDKYMLSCEGAEKEDIFFYPSINNVPVGGQEKYEAKTTLCPWKNSCKAEPKFSLVAIVLTCMGAALVVSLVAVLIFVRYKVARKRRVTPAATKGLEMEVTPPENEDRMRVCEVEDFESDNSNEEKTTVRRTREDVSVFNSHSRAPEETEQDQQTEVLEQVGTIHQLNFGEDGKYHEQSKENIEMKSMQAHQFENGSELSADDLRYFAGSSTFPEALLAGTPCGETMSVTEVSKEDRMRVYEVEDFESDNSNEEKTTVRRTREDVSVFNSHSRAPEETEQDQQTEVLEQVGTIHQLNFGEDGKYHEQSKENIEMKSMQAHQFENGSELSVDDLRESAGSSTLPEALLAGAPCGETMSVTDVSSSSDDIEALVFTDDGVNVSTCKEQCMDKTRTQTTKRRKHRPGIEKVLPIECELVTRDQTKYTDKFKKADKYRQAWITSLLGEDESHVNKSEASETSGLNTEKQE